MVYSILLLPFLGALIEGLSFKRTSQTLAGVFSTLSCFLSLCLVGLCFYFQAYGSYSLFPWIQIGNLQISFSFVLDPLSLLMSLLITGVGFLIHVYSLSYMKKDQGLFRYFSYLSFFVFSMLILVLAGNLPLLFVGWEGVGLCSYLLISFWFQDKNKVICGERAFLTNRVGDACFLIGMFLLFAHSETLDFASLKQIFESPSLSVSGASLSLAGLLLFLGATGKSAQIPLYFWLPGAMAGPTPVSALIHAATMVTAGIYMILRLFPFYMAIPDVLNFIMWIGALSALASALVATSVFDLKKILAYSTISQLAYMFMAVGVQAFTSSFFHLLTHAFFKALLFLGAGSIIHGLQGKQDIREMGGLRKYFPRTFPAFVLGACCLMALPPLSGFFSKDQILWSLLSQKNYPVFALAFLTGIITCIYVTRMLYFVFFAKENFKGKPHESSPVMWVPIWILGFLSVFSGFLGIPHVLSSYLPMHPPHLLDSFLAEWKVLEFTGSAALEFGLMAASILASITTIVLTYLYLSSGKQVGGVWTSIKRVLQAGFYVETFLEKYMSKGFSQITKVLAQAIEISFLQGFLQALPKACFKIQKLTSLSQNGDVSRYASCFLVGIIFLLGLIFIR